MTKIRVRFAPSPTGYLHVGGARTALFNWLYARRMGGTFVLRIEDTDPERSTEEALEAIYDGMRWLGLDWDEGPQVDGDYGPYFQSKRGDLYKAAAGKLLENGKAYRCWCTPEELEARRAAQTAGEAVKPGGRCCEGLGASPRKGSYTLRLATPEAGVIAWEDQVRERITFHAETIDDFVLVRSDGSPMYNFAAVVDDAAMEISHCLRGDDHISNTPRQLLIYQALELEPPNFGHLPMILGPDGTRLSKRHGATSVTVYRDQGILPEALFNFLVLLGWSYDDSRELFTREELVSAFALDRLGRTPSIFNFEKLEWMNGVYMAQLPIDTKIEIARRYLDEQGLADSIKDEEWLRRLVEALGERFKKPEDISEYADYLFTETVEMEAEAIPRAESFPEGVALLADLAARYEELEVFGAEPIEGCLRGLAKEKGLKAGALIHPTRVALTGKTHGPSLFDVMLLLGRRKTVQRLRAFAEGQSGA